MLLGFRWLSSESATPAKAVAYHHDSHSRNHDLGPGICFCILKIQWSLVVRSLYPHISLIKDFAVSLDKLVSAYVAYLPWFGLAVGILMLLAGSTTGSRSRRIMFIGLGLASLSVLWLLIRISVMA
jgi:hypothetical protein